jgi:ZZ-type zinc finger-containing protein 3
LLKTLILLESQRIQASKDLESLYKIKNKSLDDPLLFINSLKDNNISCSKNLVDNIPMRQKVYLVPEIDWNKYYESIDLEDLETIKKHKEIRVHSLRQTNKLINNLENQDSSTQKSLLNKQKSELKEGKSNHNKPWTVEEQRHLEELLLEFPPGFRSI